MLNLHSFNIDISRIIVAHEFVLNKNSKCAYQNGRKYYGIIYCIEGEAEYRFSSGDCCNVYPGEIIFLSPKASYSIITKKDFKHYTVNFEIHNEFSNMDFLTDVYYLLHTGNSQLYHHIFKELTIHWMSRKSCFEMQATACLYELLALWGSEILEKEYATSTYLCLACAKEYIEQNFNTGITLDILANYSNMSVTHFRREWLKLYGESALQYRDRIRLSYAKEYLMSGYYTVTEVAEKCGFSDVNYFIRFFKKHTGISPGKFEKIL
ncbi:MAG: helix-turn-helix transcriptional regulator [Clostridia bacterium]|nr:helix-turn-helix transcriptional regulator [Clostridia bacterium]